jgi:hypothetical protein
MHETIAWSALGWFVGWLLALGVLLRAGLALPRATPRGPVRHAVVNCAVGLSGIALALLALAAVTRHDAHFDLTREQLHTPDPAARALVRALEQPLAITYFYLGEDPSALHARDLLTLLARENRLLTLTTIDPDKQPALAITAGAKVYNTALIESGARRLWVRSTDLRAIALGIQRVLREQAVTVCFIEGHGEYAIDNDEFHTHLEGVAGHRHDQAGSFIIETTAHGAGRLKRALEAQGYASLRVPLATLDEVPEDCQALVHAGPRTRYLPAESTAIRAFLARGGSLLMLLDLAYAPDHELEHLLGELGMQLPPAVVIDPDSHYGTDQETVAVTGYPPHAVTQSISYTFFPGVRPIDLHATGAGVKTQALIASSAASYRQALAPRAAHLDVPDPHRHAHVHEHGPMPAYTHIDEDRRPPQTTSVPGAQTLGAVAEGHLEGSTAAFRAIVIGDADFASNSFFPYMANSDLALAMLRWLLREDARVVVDERVPAPSLVLLTAAQSRLLFVLVAVAMPLLACIGGVLVWWRQR